MDAQKNTQISEPWGQIKSLLKEKYNNISATHMQQMQNAGNDCWMKLQQLTGLNKTTLQNTNNNH